MTRIFTEGFELGNIQVFDLQAGSIYRTPSARSGDYGISADKNSHFDLNTGDMTEVFVRFAFRQNAGSGLFDYFKIFDDTAVTHVASLRWATNQKVQAYVNGVLVGMGSRLILHDRWYLVEARYKIVSGSSATNGVFQVKIEGVLDIDLNNLVTNPNSASYLGFIRWQHGNHNNQANHRYDDFAVNINDGGPDSSWPGDGRIIPLRPNGDVATPDFTKFPSSLTYNYEAVDDASSDGDTSYVESEISGAEDLYEVQDINFLQGDAVKRVWVAANIKETSADGDTVQLGIKPNGASSPTWTTTPPLTENYEHYKSAEHTVNPHTSSVWTETDLDNVQIGIKVS